MTSFTQEMAARREEARRIEQFRQQRDALRREVYADSLEAVVSFMSELNADPEFIEAFGRVGLDETDGDAPFWVRSEGFAEYVSFSIATDRHADKEESGYDPDFMRILFEIDINGKSAVASLDFSGHSFPPYNSRIGVELDSCTLEGLSGAISNHVIEGIDTVVARTAEDAATPRRM